jgi:hypothetical protein
LGGGHHIVVAERTQTSRERIAYPYGLGMEAGAERRAFRSRAAALRAASSILAALALAGTSGCGDAADDGLGGRRSDAAEDGGLDVGSLKPPVKATDP